MRNAILLILAALLTCTTATAGKKKATWAKGYTQNDWTLGYGFKSVISLSSSFEDMEMSNVTHQTLTADDRQSIGAISLGFTHRSGQKVSFGLQAAFEMTKQNCMINESKFAADGSKVNNYIKVGELSSRYITVTPLLRFNWVEKNKGKLTFYSKLAAGITFIGDSFDSQTEVNYEVESKKQHFFGFQVSPLGLMIGTKLGGFVEVGYGSYGIVQAGLCYKF